MAIDRVQPLKLESSTTGTEEDLFPTALDKNEDYVEARGIALQDDSSNDETTLVSRNGNDMTFTDVNNPSEVTLTELLESAEGGITEGQHENLDTLVHNLEETSYVEITRSVGKVTDVIVWTNSGKTTKVREVNITRTSGKVSQIVKKQYDGAGAIITGQTLTGTVTRSAGKVASVDWVQT